MSKATKRPHDQQVVDHEARDALRVLIPMLERIGSGSSAQVTAGYVEWPGPGSPEKLTEMGASMMKLTERVAWDSATYLYEEVTGDVAHGVDAELVNEVQGLCAITAAALAGAEPYDAPAGLTGSWVAYCLLGRARELLRRVDGGRGVPASTTVETDGPEEEAAVSNLDTGEEGHESIVERVRRHGVSLQAAGMAIEGAANHPEARHDAGLLRLVQERASAATEYLWHVELDYGTGEKPKRFGQLADVLYDLPVLAMAAELAVQDAGVVVQGDDPSMTRLDRWEACEGAAKRAGRALIAWAEKHGEEVAYV